MTNYYANDFQNIKDKSMNTFSNLNKFKPKIHNTQYSGFSEFPLLGVSVAKGLDFNRTRVQADAFRTPKEVQRKLKLKTFK